MSKNLTLAGNHALVDYTPVTEPHTPLIKPGAWEAGGLINVRMANDVDHNVPTFLECLQLYDSHWNLNLFDFLIRAWI